jgi:sigma-54 specific flagellar transcriptional regulator A
MVAVATKARSTNQVKDWIVGNSPYIRHLKTMIARVAASEMSVLITGPSGAGKELVARAIHAASDRSGGPFVAINCGAIPSELIESELFGHERGSFTGAIGKRIGRFEEADGGTLFLDEIGDMRFDMQVKLLRVLEERMVNRIGGSAAVPINVRIISATHQNLQNAIDANTFREDLYFRLGVIPIRIPLLINHFQKLADRRTWETFTPSGIDRLKQHDWPGNIRELRNIVERASVLYTGEQIDASKAEQLLGIGRATKLVFENRVVKAYANVIAPPIPSESIETLAPNAASHGKMPINLKELLETMELERIQVALDMADGVISEAARLLTLKRTTLIEKIRKYGIDRIC